MRKQCSQHLKGCKIYLLSVFLFLFHLTKPGILLHYLVWGFSYGDPERMLHHLSPKASALLLHCCRTMLKLMGSCALTIIDSEKVCQGIISQWERTGKRSWASPGPRLKGMIPYMIFLRKCDGTEINMETGIYKVPVFEDIPELPRWGKKEVRDSRGSRDCNRTTLVTGGIGAWG